MPSHARPVLFCFDGSDGSLIALRDAGALLAPRAAVDRVENTRSTVWQTVVEVADEIDAALVVCGARGRNALKRAVLGSVAEAVLHHSRRVALIAPQPSVT